MLIAYSNIEQSSKGHTRISKLTNSTAFSFGSWMFWCACLIALFLMTAPVTSWAKDITQQVINQTEFDEEVAQACLDYCQGNRRHGVLTRVLIDRSGTQTFKLRGEANFRNYHFQESLEVFGQLIGGVTLFDYTVVIIAEGVLDEKTCKFRVDKVMVENDQVGLSSLAQREEGKVYFIDNCKSLTADL